MAIVYENLKESDIDQLSELECSCSCTPWSKESLMKETANPLAHYIVAKDSDKIVAYIGIWQVMDEAHITNISVHSDYRKQGIGTTLLEKIIDFCKLQNIHKIFLEVRVSNISAINLYKKFGFVEIAVRKKYYSNNQEDASIMSLEM